MTGPLHMEAFLKATGMTQTELATGIGRSDASVSLYLSGNRRPTFETAYLLEQFTREKLPSHVVPVSSWVRARVTTAQPPADVPDAATAEKAA